MKEVYLTNILKKAKQELKLKDQLGVRVEVSKTGEKITLDGVEFFDSVKEVAIYYYQTLIATYDLTSKTLYSKRFLKNIEAVKVMVEIVNNFVGYTKLGVKEKALKDFEIFKEDLAEDISNYEAGELFAIN